VFSRQGIELRLLVSAAAAPGGKEVDQDPTAPVGSQIKLMAVTGCPGEGRGGLAHQRRQRGDISRPSAVAQQWNGEQHGGRKDGEYQPESVPAAGGQARLWIHDGGTPHPHTVLRRADERLANSGHSPKTHPLSNNSRLGAIKRFAMASPYAKSLEVTQR
jgi:hypothetical protein